MVRLPSISSNFVESLLKLTRFGNLVIIGFAQYFTAAFLIGKQSIYDFRLLLLSIATVAIVAAGYIINDYYDVKIDYINKPDRVVIGKDITRRYAILFHVLLSALGILIGFYLSWAIATINLLSVFLLWLYSNFLKRLPFIGNLTVAFLTGSAIYVVDALYRTHSSLVIIYAIFAFFMTLVREIIKDMEDLRGDNTFGCKTLPIVLGIRKTKLIIYLLIAAFSVVVVVLDQLMEVLPFRYSLLFLFIPLLWFLNRLARADMKKDFSRLSTLCKVIMLLGIVSMAFV
ncbi:MAG: geranylgeranylglycerol-phosphate geranylgeranyltransferase [Cyclobacteriaceae bacterium]|jgi:4-hydroxybenzoate polyprenyltransferase|nr:geranylgeranylglycerol-phosphate geranylgeranyltransferase [Cyclobacteriaceae bacterium]MDH4294712.1 geranylgeranylglycerol-phosphate geranylgeranyltransferase [Cyclobacteriaceae bacterium]MDH5250776.1 geranylgeranylglycerol-phosphate geranylgeranyltransferase [Cyclobacteriaceae bacterium]